MIAREPGVGRGASVQRVTTQQLAAGIGLLVATVIGALGPTVPQLQAQTPAVTPPCWIRGDPADLELRISPLDSAAVVVADERIKVCYGRPRALGRPIMGRVVPYEETWRFGANEATTIFLPVPVAFGDVEVEPGRYSLYTIPGPEGWRMVVNADWKRWGIPIDSTVRAADVASIAVRPGRTPEHVEMFTISLVPVDSGTALLTVAWERTQLEIPIVARRE